LPGPREGTLEERLEDEEPPEEELEEEELDEDEEPEELDEEPEELDELELLEGAVSDSLSVARPSGLSSGPDAGGLYSRTTTAKLPPLR
jgi:hypothetical protein